MHFAFALSDDFASFQRHKLAELMFELTQRVAEATNRLAAHRPGCDAPFQKGFVCARNRFAVIVVGSGANASEPPPVDRRNFVNHRATAAPFAIEHASVVVGETQFFQRCFHKRCVTQASCLYSSSGDPARPPKSRLRSLHDLSGWKPELRWLLLCRLGFICGSGRTCASIPSLHQSLPQ